MSLADFIQDSLASETDFTEHMDEPVNDGVLERLMTMNEFRRAYEPNGLKPDEFISYGATQRTLAQFVEVGWLPICEYKI